MAAGVKWTKTATPGIWKRETERGRRYRVVARDGSGRQITTTEKTFEAAKSWKHANSGDHRPQDVAAAQRTLQQAYEQQHATRSYSPATLHLHAAAWRHLEPLADRPVGKISPADVDRVLGSITAPVMRERARAMFSTVMNFAIRQGWIQRNPVTRPRIVRTRQERMEQAPRADRTRYLLQDELGRLLDAMPARFRALVELMARMGLRPGEAYALTVGKFTPATEVPARPATLRIDTSTTGATKTGEVRTLRLPSVVAEMLSDHVARFITSDQSSLSDDDLLFPTATGRQIAGANFRALFADAAHEAGLDDVSPNTLRHSAASFAISTGASIYDVMKMLGHARASVTLDVYGGLFEEAHEAFVERYDAAIREAKARAT